MFIFFFDYFFFFLLLFSCYVIIFDDLLKTSDVTMLIDINDAKTNSGTLTHPSSFDLVRYFTLLSFYIHYHLYISHLFHSHTKIINRSGEKTHEKVSIL